MGIGGLQWQTVDVGFVAGLNQKADPRALQPPGLLIAKDIQFDELGGIQTRKPYATIGTQIYLGFGATIVSVRRIVDNGGELLAFTKDKLYSWSPALTKWVEKATYLAVKVDEETAFSTTGDQLDADRAELAGVEVFTWCDAGKVYVGARDKNGGIIVAPTAVATGGGVGNRPRIVALQTKLLLFWNGGTDVAPGVLYVLAIDPADVLSSVLSAAAVVVQAPVAGVGFGAYYDVCQVDGADQAVVVARRATTTAYSVATVTAGLAIASGVIARNCDQAVAVASMPGGAGMLVVRRDAGVVYGDQLAIATLTDLAAVNVVIGGAAPVLTQVTAAFRTAKVGGHYRAYVFWTANEADNATNWQSSVNWIDDSGAVGAAGVFVRRLGLASRAFAYDGRVFVWTTFGGASTFAGANLKDFRAQLQNSYFLYREADHNEPLLVAKSTFQRGGGLLPTVSHLPGVALTLGATTFSWCATERRIVAIGAKQSGYGARSPRDCTFTFDSNEARRCVRLGATLYVTGGEVLQYDGAGLFEVGFHVYPWWFGVTQGIGGTLPNGTYAFKSTDRWQNARGETERSTTATVASLTIAGGPASFAITGIVPLYVTHKLATLGFTAPACELWRSQINPTADAPFYLVTSLDPASPLSPNGYIANDPSVSTTGPFADMFDDATILTKNANPENGAVLENLAPPAATIIAASADRLFLAGIAGDPNRLWYSKQRNDGEVAAFHDTLTVAIPPDGGAITGLAFLQEQLVVFKETAVFVLGGDGLDNLGLGQNYGPPRMVTHDVGALNAESIAITPEGVVFKSAKGWYLLNRGFAVEYIGGAISDYDAETVLAVHVSEAQHQVRVVTPARVLVLDYLVDSRPWMEWSVAGAVGATLHGGVHHIAFDGDVKAQRDDYVGIDYGMDVELAPVKFGGLQNFARVRWLELLGEIRGACTVQIRLARDNSSAYFDDKPWTPSPTTVGGTLQVRHSPSIQQVEAMKLRITVGAVAGVYSEGVKLTGVAFEIGLRRGLFRHLPAAQKQ